MTAMTATSATSATTFTIETVGKVAHLQLNRPDAYNSMTREFWSELPQAVRALDATGETRALVISSTGKHFCAGMDLGVFSGGVGAPADGAGASKEEGRVRARLRETVLALQDSFTALETARFPVLAAIQGGCIGGAVDMVSACDLRFASSDAFFCVQEINIGMTADVGTLQRLPKIIPDGIAREMAYRGNRVPAARAAEIGLVNEVFDTHEALVDGTLAIAQEIASKSPLAIWGTKEMATYTRDHSVADSLRHMAAWQSGMFQPADMMETFVAKSEGRDPEFDDLLPHGTGL
jgi:enoyl-CoA hydratase